MSQLVTLSRKDPLFPKYLHGTFSDKERALPVQSLNVNTEHEQVTFQIVPIEKIEKPVFLIKWARIMKLHNLTLLGFTLFAILIKNSVDGIAFDPALALLSAIGAFCLHIGVNLRNDYQDHINGLDRIHPQGGSQAIQKGWITAARVRTLSFVFLFIGIIFGLPSLFVYPELFILIGTIALLAIVGFSQYRMGMKYRLWSEVTIFLLLGPLLSVGYQYAIGCGFDLEVVLLGCTVGLLGAYFIHLKNFQAILVNSQAKFHNTISELGFEKSKTFLIAWWWLFFGFLNLYHYIYAATSWFWIIFLGSLGPTIYVFKGLNQLHSPLGSKVDMTVDKNKKIGIFVLALWTLEYLSYLIVIELSS